MGIYLIMSGKVGRAARRFEILVYAQWTSEQGSREIIALQWRQRLFSIDAGFWNDTSWWSWMLLFQISKFIPMNSDDIPLA